MLPLLEIKDLCVQYGDTVILNGISLIVDKGSLTAIIGFNGVGKSTILRAIIGTLSQYGGRMTEGDIYFAGESIKNLEVHERVRQGIAYAGVERNLFKKLSAEDNLKLAFEAARDRGLFLNQQLRTLEYYYEIFPLLKKIAQKPVGLCSGGEQQLVAIVRALLTQAKLLVLDEPSIGLSPMLLYEILEKLLFNIQDCAVLMSEQEFIPLLQKEGVLYTLEKKGKLIKV